MEKCVSFQTKVKFLGFELEDGRIVIPNSQLDKIRDI